MVAASTLSGRRPWAPYLRLAAQAELDRRRVQATKRIDRFVKTAKLAYDSLPEVCPCLLQRVS